MNDRAARFTVSLLAWLVSHNVADHLLQTDHEAGHKADKEGWVAPMAGHITSYSMAAEMTLQIAEAATGVRIRTGRRILGHLVSGGTHAFIDRRWPIRVALERTGAPGFAQLQTPINGPYLADQAAHWACLFLAAAVMAVDGNGKESR